MKRRPEPQVTYVKIAETDQDRCKGDRGGATANPMGSDGTQLMGRHPTQERPFAKDRYGARGVTLRTGSTNETEAKKRRMARSGHSKRASVRPTAEADKGSTKKERGWNG